MGVSQAVRGRLGGAVEPGIVHGAASLRFMQYADSGLRIQDLGAIEVVAVAGQSSVKASTRKHERAERVQMGSYEKQESHEVVAKHGQGRCDGER
jgi:hypothetical protein